MADPYLGEIRMFSFKFAPQGWAKCDGQLLPKSQNQPLFALFGTMYGGDGIATFALPDLRGRVPMHVGDGFAQGKSLGEAAHQLTESEYPAHTHAVVASGTDGDAPVPFGPGGNLLARTVNNVYHQPASLVALNPATLSNAGASQPHQNMQPYLTINFCVCLQGVLPQKAG